MRNTPLSKLRKKKTNYFRRIGIVRKGRRRKTTIEYIVRRSYEALPKNLKEYIEDPEQAIKQLSHMINLGYENINPYEALRQAANYTKRKSGDNTKQFIWNRFRTERASQYNSLNAAMYRAGYSARNYFIENVVYTQSGSEITAYCELPRTTKYSMLEIIYDFSGQYFDAFLFHNWEYNPKDTDFQFYNDFLKKK